MKRLLHIQMVIRSLLPNPYEIDSGLRIKVHQIAIRRACRTTRESANAFFGTFAGQAPKHLIDYTIDAKIAEMDERLTIAQRIGERSAVEPEMIIVERAEVIPAAELDRPSKAM